MKTISVYYQTIKRLSTLSLLVILVGTEAWAQVQKPNSSRTDEALVITGVLLNKDGSPLVAKRAYFLNVENGQSVLSIKEGKLINPSGESDSKGRFVIEVNRTFMGQSKEFTVGIRDPFFNMITLRRDGIPVIFSIDRDTEKLDLGNVFVE